jgi:hypothetical protein
MVRKDRFAPSENGASAAKPLSPCKPTELLAQFKRIDEAWKKAEQILADTHVPIDVKIKVDEKAIVDDQFGTVGQAVRFLGYFKTKGSRRICVDRYTLRYSGSEDEEVTPVTECSVDERIEMFDAFRRLYDEARAVADSYIPKIKERVDKFEVSLNFIDL